MYGYPWFRPTVAFGASFTKAEEAANLAAERQAAFNARQAAKQASAHTDLTDPGDGSVAAKPPVSATNPDVAPPPAKMTRDDRIVTIGALVLVVGVAWWASR